MTDVQKLVEESGMITHFKTIDKFRSANKDWHVLVSPFYHDSISDTVREADLIVEKRFNSELNVPAYSSDQLNIQLFIECKFIKQEVVVWFDEIDREKAINALSDEIGLEAKTRVAENELHYFKNNKVAKLFSTNSNKEDLIYKALNQCLHSLINFRRTGKRPIKHAFTGNAKTHVIQYPVIVCKNFKNISEVIFNQAGDFKIEKIDKHFCIETNYRGEYFLVDVVDIDHLDDYMKMIEKEAQSILEVHSAI